MTSDQIEQTAALVGAGVQGAVEGLFFVVALFLATRMLVLVAPVGGRRLGRWLLGLGIPGLLVLGVAGRTLFDGGWEKVSESIGVAAVGLAIPLGLLWLVALAARLLRRVAGHRSRLPSRRRDRREGLRLAVVGGLLFFIWSGLVLSAQWVRYEEERRAEAKTQGALRAQIRTLEATEEKADEFAEEAAALGERMSVLRQIIPERLDVLDFMDVYERECERHGLEVGVWRSSEAESSSVVRADIDIRLSGPPGALEPLGLRTERMRRLAKWSVLGSGPRDHYVRVSVFAMPDPPPPTPSECMASTSHVWLWPFTQGLRSMRRDREPLCAALAGHEATRARVDAFLANRARFHTLVDEVERLRGEGSDSATVASAPGAPPA